MSSMSVQAVPKRRFGRGRDGVSANPYHPWLLAALLEDEVG
jgi:hypothetical protein